MNTLLPNLIPEVKRDNEKASIRCCPVCEKQSAVKIKHIKMTVPEGHSLQHDYDIVACEHCGMIFHDVAPLTQRESYYETYTGDKRVDYTISSEKWQLDKIAIDFLESSIPQLQHSSLLDVGSSFGAFLMQLKSRGYQALYALDPDKAAMQYLSEQGIHSIDEYATAEIKNFENKFDVVSLRHVLEHLYTPRETLNNVAKWIKSEGFLYIELPDLTLYQESAPFPGFYFEFEHINHFTAQSLCNLLRDFELVAYDSSSTIYPCQRALFKKCQAQRALIHTDDQKFVDESFRISSPQGRVVLKNITELANQKVALWGVSVFVYRLLTHTPLNRCQIELLVDGNPNVQGQKLMGLTVQSPESLYDFEGVIVISGMNSANSILKVIETMGLSNKVVHLMRDYEFKANET